MVVDSPQVFFDVMKRLNHLAYSVHVNYPVSFIKVTDGIETKFNLQFHQNH